MNIVRGLVATLVLVLGIAGLVTAESDAFAIWGTDGAAITNDSLDQLYVSVWGDKVVYSQYDPANGSDDVLGYDFSTESTFAVSALYRNESYPRISGNTVVWVADQRPRPYTDVWAKDLVTGETVNLSDVAGSAEYADDPAIHGDFVVWDNTHDSSEPLHLYHLPSGTELEIPGPADNPDIWSEGEEFRIAWEDDSGPFDTILLATGHFDPATAAYSAVTTQTLWDLLPPATPAQAADVTAPSIWGDIIAWQDWTKAYSTGGLDIYALDMAATEIHPVGVANDHDTDPQVCGNWITWGHWHGGSSLPEPPTSVDNYLYSFETKTSVCVSDTATRKGNGVLHGNRLAWIDLSSPDNEVMATVLGSPVGRSAGTDRYATAIRTSQLHFSKANTVVLATGANFPDALAASALAGAYECPILLTPGDALPSNVKAEIDRLGATQVVLVGGEGVLSAELEVSLEAEYAVRRIAGGNRYETSAAIAEEALGIWGTDGAAIWGVDGAGRTTGIWGTDGAAIWGTDGAARGKLVFVARGDSFADALAVSPVAYATGVPVLLTGSGQLSSDAAEYIAGQGCLEAIILGGTGAVSAQTQAQIDELLDANGGTPSERWQGATRFETGATIAGNAIDRGWAASGRVGLATGLSFPDALAGGPAIGAGDGVLLLVDPGAGAKGSAAGDLIEERHAAVGRIEVFGGTAVVSDARADSYGALWESSFDGYTSVGDPAFFTDPAFAQSPPPFEDGGFFE